MTDLEHLTSLYHDWQDATEAATSAQHDIVVFMQQHLHGKQDAPPHSMQAVADALWRVASDKQAALAEYFNSRLHPQ